MTLHLSWDKPQTCTFKKKVAKMNCTSRRSSIQMKNTSVPSSFQRLLMIGVKLGTSLFETLIYAAFLQPAPRALAPSICG